MPDRVQVDIAAWVEKARADPGRYLERQATEIVLNALDAAPELDNRVFLKGGVLMGLVYNSPRQTADLDYSTSIPPDRDVAEKLRDSLNHEMRRATARLGYPEIVCQVQKIRKQPRPDRFHTSIAPALELKIAYARRGTRQEARLQEGQAANVVDVDISFNEPVNAIQLLHLEPSGSEISAYALTDLIAEKFRALLQQEIRNRNRRQDVYDITFLLQAFDVDESQRTKIFAAFQEKCGARDIRPTVESMSNPEVARRARSEWHTLVLEIDELPDFETCFAVVEEFYRSMPWGRATAVTKETKE